MFFLRYCGALIYDSIILFVLFFVTTALILLFHSNGAIPPSTHWYQFSLIVVSLIYYYCSIRYGGQTVGMKAWQFKLSTLSQDTLSNQQIILRIVYFIPAILLAPFYFKGSYILLNRWTKTQFQSI